MPCLHLLRGKVSACGETVEDNVSLTKKLFASGANSPFSFGKISPPAPTTTAKGYTKRHGMWLYLHAKSGCVGRLITYVRLQGVVSTSLTIQPSLLKKSVTQMYQNLFSHLHPSPFTCFRSKTFICIHFCSCGRIYDNLCLLLLQPVRGVVVSICGREDNGVGASRSIDKFTFWHGYDPEQAEMSYLLY